MKGKLDLGNVSLVEAHSILSGMLKEGIVADVKLKVDVIEGQIELKREGFQQMTMDDQWGGDE